MARSRTGQNTRPFVITPLLRRRLEADMTVGDGRWAGQFYKLSSTDFTDLTQEAVLQNLEEAGIAFLVVDLGILEVGSREEDRAYLGLRRASEGAQVMVDPLKERKKTSYDTHQHSSH